MLNFNEYQPGRDSMIRILTLVLFTLLANAALAQSIEVIPLKNRSADEMIPIVRPLLKPGEAITGTGYQLILRASPQTVTDVRQILSKLDRGLSNLMISVRQGGAVDTESNEAGAVIRYDSTTGATVSGSIAQNRTGNDWRDVQRVRALEGSPAHIQTGTTITQPEVVRSNNGTTTTYSSTRTIGSGFYVLPRLNGNQVHLEISPFREALTGDGLTTSVQRANTAVSGWLGDWIFVGGGTQEESSTQSGLLSRSNSRSESEFGIYLKVEIAE